MMLLLNVDGLMSVDQVEFNLDWKKHGFYGQNVVFFFLKNEYDSIIK